MLSHRNPSERICNGTDEDNRSKERAEEADHGVEDLALVLAAASSFRDKPIDPATAAIGEVGLTGEIRAVTGLQQRLSEASRTGFKTCIIPRHGTGNLTAPDGMELLRVRNIREAIELVLS